MHVFVQWATRSPRAWLPVDSGAWAEQPTKALPRGGDVIDDQPGWVNRLNVQGVEFVADHYAVEQVPGGACRVSVWWDDPDDYPPEMFFARVWTFKPLRRDPRIGGRWNTEQSQVIYGAAAFLAKLRADLHGAALENADVRPWVEFTPPADAHVRHGVWLPDTVYLAHEATARAELHGWREWTEGVPASSIRNGRVIG